MSNRIQISLGQMDVVRGDTDANWTTASEMTAEAARRGSQLIVLPELWPTGYDLKRAAQYATPVTEGAFAEVSALAARHRISIVGSQLSLIAGKGFGNTAVFFDEQGLNRGTYHKIHLFGAMEEDVYLTGGDSLVTVDASWGRTGLSICYDLRFPELFRAYAFAGATMMIMVAEWPQPRLAHWRTLLRARAIENQMFIVACNRVGQTRTTTFFGHSCLIDPCGEIVIEGGEQSDLITAEIDLDQVAVVRSQMPVFDDRRLHTLIENPE